MGRLTITPFAGVTGAGYGLGLIQINDLIGDTGAINGGGASMFRYEAQDATFVVLVNGSSHFENIADAVVNSLIGDLYPEQANRPAR